MTYAEAKARLDRAVAGATALHPDAVKPMLHGRHDPLKRFMEAIDGFPKSAGEVPAYRDTLKRLAPEMRGVLEHALSWVTES